MSEKSFIKGISVYQPSSKAPSFIKCQIVVDDEFIAYYQSNKGAKTLRFDIKESRKLDEYGRPKLYAELNNFVPKNPVQEETIDSLAEDMEAGAKTVDYPNEDISPADIPW